MNFRMMCRDLDSHTWTRHLGKTDSGDEYISWDRDIKDADGVYTWSVTINAKKWADSVNHELCEGQAESVEVVFTWNAAEEKWECGDVPVVEVQDIRQLPIRCGEPETTEAEGPRPL